MKYHAAVILALLYADRLPTTESILIRRPGVALIPDGTAPTFLASRSDATTDHQSTSCVRGGNIGSKARDAKQPVQKGNTEACMEYCQSTPGCTHFTYNLTSKYCHIKSGRPQFYTYKNDVTGSRSCDFSCFVKGVTYTNAPQVADTLSTPLATDCQAACAAEPKCKVFVWHEDESKCYFKGEGFGKHKEVGVHPDAIAGPKEFCDMGGNLMQAEVANGGAPPTPSTGPQVTPGLQGPDAGPGLPPPEAEVEEPSEGDTAVGGSETEEPPAGGESVEGPEASTPSGSNDSTLTELPNATTDNPREACIHKGNTGSKAPNIKNAVQKGNTEACMEYCQSTPGCTHFTYNLTSKYCHIKSGRPQFYTYKNDVTGSRSCDFSCFVKGVTYTNAPQVADTLSTPLATDCQAACAAEPKCKVFVWHEDESKCYFKGEGFGKHKEVGVHPDAIAGPKEFCDMGGNLMQAEVANGGAPPTPSTGPQVTPGLQGPDAGPGLPPPEAEVEEPSEGDTAVGGSETEEPPAGGESVEGPEASTPSGSNDSTLTELPNATTDNPREACIHKGNTGSKAPNIKNAVQKGNTEACMEYCQSTPGCTHFTYNLTSKYCHIKSGRPQFYTYKNDVTGSRSCDFSCFVKGVTYTNAPQVADTLSTPLATDCQAACAAEPKCKVFVWHEDESKCYFKGEGFGKHKEVGVHPDAIAGPKEFCDMGGNLMQAEVANGGAPPTPSTGPQVTPGLQGPDAGPGLPPPEAEVEEPSEGDTAVGGSETEEPPAGGESVEGPEASTPSGSNDSTLTELPNATSDNPREACIHKGNTGSKAPNIKNAVQKGNTEACMEYCQSTPGCTHFTYNLTSKYCHIKSGRPQFYTYKNDVTGSRSCDFSCFVKGVTYTNAPQVADTLSTPLATDCQAACAAEPKCKVFVWHEDESKCYFKGEGFGKHKEVGVHPDAIAGPKEFCDMGGNLMQAEVANGGAPPTPSTGPQVTPGLQGSDAGPGLPPPEAEVEEPSEGDTAVGGSETEEPPAGGESVEGPEASTPSGSNDSTLTELPNATSDNPREACIHKGNTGSKAPNIKNAVQKGNTEACMEYCQSTPGCTHFTYNLTSKYCHIKSGRPQFYTYKNDVTGSRSCDFSCFVKGVTYTNAPQVADTLSTPLATDCQAACAAEPKCKVFVWHEDESKCYFKGEGFGKHKEVGVHPDAIAGPKEFCDMGGNLMQAEVANGGAPPTPSTGPQVTPGLQGSDAGPGLPPPEAEVEEPSEGDTAVGGSETEEPPAGGESVEGPEASTPSGSNDSTLTELPNATSDNPREACIHKGNTGSKAPNIKNAVQKGNTEACMEYCQSTPGCTHFTYNLTSKYCHIKSGRPQFYTYKNDVTGSRSCDFSCFVKGVTYTNAPQVADTLSTPLATDCQAACAAEPKCRVFVWEEDGSICRLYGEGFTAHEETGEFPRAIAGPKEFCDMGGNIARTGPADW
ncbi:hypothetical protein BESB_063420 [Besnoitia besnoiti]|uniref:Apple domain-containing protein n=1 Tax=Besnoitia besnoiti TaxID=94643 RepID=A0A2A9MBU9_BESBE|nr:hypothetical protein BESB_063420 [Besnoitia besnoiti]PFH35455.1 hypothetical protein BESB_063420 [Besnoitia besnoiti]